MNGHYPHEPVITELQGRITKAEAALRDKEEENVMLKQQLEQYERKWSEYEAKMKSMEEAWKRQLSSLQVIIYVDFFMFVCIFKEWINIFLQHEFSAEPCCR
jgi:myosin V